MHVPLQPSSPVASSLLLAQAFAVVLSPRVAAAGPAARMAVAVPGEGAWSFAFARPHEVELAWDPEADLQILCDRESLESIATGVAITPDRLFLVAGRDALLDRLGGLFAGAGSPLQVRMRGAG